ncbi:lauroyl acyltransferase [Thalassobaculum sp.]|uniref:LpxL/LpxP family acyltransferase n=1 Tax=Thalassobaculum sp. TaxID=2022740 RepID=UPI0032EC9E3E
MSRLLTRLLQPLEAALVLAFYGLFSLLPTSASSATGAWLLRRIGPLIGAHRTARRNLERTYPDHPASEIDSILDGMWANLGRNIGEFPHLKTLLADPAVVQVDGMETIEALREAGGPVIFVGAHLANWEIAPVVALRHGFTVDFIYRAPNNPWVNRLLERRRIDPAGVMIPKGAEGGRRALAALKAQRSLGILVDQKMNEGIEARFFGRPAMTTPAFAQLALRFDVPVVPVRFERLGGPRFRVTVDPPIQLERTGDRSTDVAALVQAVNDRVESWIRERPEQWFWVHRRWRDKPIRTPGPV